MILKCVCEAALKNVEEEVRERCGKPMMLDNSTLWTADQRWVAERAVPPGGEQMRVVR